MLKLLTGAVALTLLLGVAADVDAAPKRKLAKRKPLKRAQPVKVLIAHSTGVLDDYDPETLEYLGTYYFFNVISVGRPAVKAHAGHGDVVEGELLPDGTLFDTVEYAKGDKIVMFVPVVVEEPPVEEPPVEEPPVEEPPLEP